MDTAIGPAPPQAAEHVQRQPTPPLRRPARRIVVGLSTRPEPFTPFDYERARRVRLGYAWGAAGGGALVVAAVAALLLYETAPQQPEALRAAPAEAVVATTPAPQPVLLPVVASLPAEPPAPPPPAPPPAPREVVTTGNTGSNLRATPSLSGQVLWTAPKGTRLQVAGEDGLWVRVNTPGGNRTGWMHRSVLADPPG